MASDLNGRRYLLAIIPSKKWHNYDFHTISTMSGACAIPR